MKKDRWQERHILRPYLAFDSILCEALQHNLPPFTPPPHTEDSVYPMPRVIFRMFDYTDDPEVRECRTPPGKAWPEAALVTSFPLTNILRQGSFSGIQIGFEVTNSRISAFQELGLQTCTTLPSSEITFETSGFCFCFCNIRRLEINLVF